MVFIVSYGFNDTRKKVTRNYIFDAINCLMSYYFCLFHLHLFFENICSFIYFDWIILVQQVLEKSGKNQVFFGNAEFYNLIYPAK